MVDEAIHHRTEQIMGQIIAVTRNLCIARMRLAHGAARPIVQALEGRRLLSVSGADLVGPETPGNTYSYQIVESGEFQHTVIVGPATFNGHAVVERHDFTSTSSNVPQSPPVKNFNAFNDSGQYIHYGSSSTEENGDATVITVASGNVLVPGQLVAGQTYSFNWAPDTITTGGVTIVDTAIRTQSVTLPSETLQSVTVPAGTFQAYLFNSTTVVESSIIDLTVTITGQQWVAPGIGLVKYTSQTDASPGIETRELISYDLAGTEPTPTPDPTPDPMGSAATQLKIDAGIVAITAAKANIKSVSAANKLAAAAEKGVDLAAIAVVKAQIKADKGNPAALATDKANLAAATSTFKAHLAAAKAKAKADNAAIIAQIKGLTAQLKADKQQLKLDKKAEL